MTSTKKTTDPASVSFIIVDGSLSHPGGVAVRGDEVTLKAADVRDRHGSLPPIFSRVAEASPGEEVTVGSVTVSPGTVDDLANVPLLALIEVEREREAEKTARWEVLHGGGARRIVAESNARTKERNRA